MKRTLKILAALGLIMSTTTGAAKPPTGIDYIIRYYDNSDLSGEPVGGYTQYCDWNGYGWGQVTIYGTYEESDDC